MDLKKGPRPALIHPGEVPEFREVLQPRSRLVAWPSGRRRHRQIGVRQLLSDIAEFAGLLGGGMDRPVIDKTEITGIFNLNLQFARDESTAGFLPPPPPGIPAEPQPAVATDPAGPSIFTAIQEQLGLKLDRGRGAGQFLVVDHIERPSGN